MYTPRMPKRSSKTQTDVNLIAKSIVDEATDEKAVVGLSTGAVDVPPEKNPAAVALGRLGGLKGGKARAEKLTANKRSQIAKKAALARWSKPKKNQ